MKGRTRGSLPHKRTSCLGKRATEMEVKLESTAEISVPRYEDAVANRRTPKGQVSEKPIRYVSTDARCAQERNLQISVRSG